MKSNGAYPNGANSVLGVRAAVPSTFAFAAYGGGPVVATHFSVEHLLAARLILA
jgi:hypothetical protein